MNKFWIIRVLVVIYWVGSGIQCTICGSARRHGIVGDARCTMTYAGNQYYTVSAFMTGFVTVDAAGDPTGYIDLKKDAIIGGSARGIPLRAGRSVHIRHHAVKIEIEERYNGHTYRYAALFSSNKGATPLTSLRLQQSPPMVLFDDGWVFMSGDWPLAEARLVAAISDGTKLIVQSTTATGAAKDTDRVYLLNAGSTVNVTKKQGAESKPMTDKNQFCTVVKNTAGFDCVAIDVTDEPYKHIAAMAVAAGMN